MEVGVHEAKTKLSELLRRVAAGEQITITRGGHPVAKLVPTESPRRRELGQFRGQVSVAEDFDAPLPPDVMAGFQ